MIHEAKLISALRRAGRVHGRLRLATDSDLAEHDVSFHVGRCWMTLPRTWSSVDVRQSIGMGGRQWGRFGAADHDLRIDVHADVVVAIEGDACRRCGGVLHDLRGVEVGHIFPAGNALTAATSAPSREVEGTQVPLEMSCAGLGVTRLCAVPSSAVHGTPDGVRWPTAVAPFDAFVGGARNDVMSKAGEILSRAGFDALVDDRSTECGESRRLAEYRLGLPATVWIAESEDVLVGSARGARTGRAGRDSNNSSPVWNEPSAPPDGAEVDCGANGSVHRCRCPSNLRR